MEKRDVNLTPGLVVESVGEDLMVLVPRSGDAIRLTGSAAEIVSALQAGGSVSEATSGVDELRSLGIVSVGPGLSRRVLIRSGAVGLGSAIAVLAMPTAVAASSGGGSGGGGTVINKTLLRTAFTGSDVTEFRVEGMSGTGSVTVLESLIGITFTAAVSLPVINFSPSSPIAGSINFSIRFEFGGVEYLAATT